MACSPGAVLPRIRAPAPRPQSTRRAFGGVSAARAMGGCPRRQRAASHPPLALLGEAPGRSSHLGTPRGWEAAEWLLNSRKGTHSPAGAEGVAVTWGSRGSTGAEALPSSPAPREFPCWHHLLAFQALQVGSLRVGTAPACFPRTLGLILVVSIALAGPREVPSSDPGPGRVYVPRVFPAAP